MSPKKPEKKLSSKKRDAWPDSAFAFEKQRKEPLVDAKHVRNAIARFDQVKDVGDKARDRAWKKIVRAAKEYDVEVGESDWRDLASTKSKKSAAKKSKKSTESTTAKKVKGAGKAEQPPQSASKKSKRAKVSGRAKKVKDAGKAEKAPQSAAKRSKKSASSSATSDGVKAATSRDLEREFGHG